MDSNLPFVYIVTNRFRGTIYIGVTTDLPLRISQHKQKMADGFTRRYNLDKLVWFEPHESICQAIVREKQLKKWNRAWKLEMIENFNPRWCDLYGEIVG